LIIVRTFSSSACSGGVSISSIYKIYTKINRLKTEKTEAQRGRMQCLLI
jgi:hypothetical protein